jgi:alpha-D-ribose 1-methylphosphonate 5-triphosphate synthase subunit PhnG
MLHPLEEEMHKDPYVFQDSMSLHEKNFDQKTLTRRVRTQILILNGGRLASELAQEVRLTQEIVLLEAPDYALVMVQQRESARNSRFLLGEVLVSHCRVLVNGVLGLGILLGQDLKLAEDLAILDAIWNSNTLDLFEWTKRLQTEASIQAIQRQKEDELTLASRVDFESMDRES